MTTLTTATVAHTAPPPTFEDVYRAHYDFVWRSVRRLGVPEFEVDDVVQDVFVVAHRRLASFEGRSKLSTWLFGIAYRVVRDYRQARSAARRREEQVSAPRPPTEPDRKLERSEAARVLDTLLAQLSEPAREVLVMADIVKLTAPEIAEVTGARLNTVYSRLRLARKRFNALLDAYVQANPHGLTWSR